MKVETPQQEPVNPRASPVEFPEHKAIKGIPAGTPILRQPFFLPVAVIFAFLWTIRSSPGMEVSAPPGVAAGWQRQASTTYLLTLLDVIILPGVGASHEHDFELLLVPAVKRQEQDLNQLLRRRGEEQGPLGAGGGLVHASVERTNPPPFTTRLFLMQLSVTVCGCVSPCLLTNKEEHGKASLSMALGQTQDPNDRGTKGRPRPVCL